jgi:hypothetical protein
MKIQRELECKDECQHHWSEWEEGRTDGGFDNSVGSNMWGE